MDEVVVVGAGYAGMTAALSLAGRTRRRGGVRVQLVNPQERFVERVRLHQTAAGESLADWHIPTLVGGQGVEFVRGWVSGIEADARTVRLADGRRLGYDRLVYALGAVADTHGVPGVAEHAYTLDTFQGAEALAERLRALGTGTAVVVGAGLTGVESATEIAHQHPGIRVVLLSDGEPVAMMGPRARAYVARALDRLGVQVRSDAEVVKVLPGGIELSDGHLDADAVLWTAGVRVSPLAAAAGFDVDNRGRIITDSALRSTSHPNVYAVGDAAAIRQGYGVMHGTCGAGFATAGHAAASIARELRGKQPEAFRYGYYHQAASLGRDDAVVQFTRADDSPAQWTLRGRSAVAYKEAFSSAPGPTWMLLPRFPGALVWRHGGRANRVQPV